MKTENWREESKIGSKTKLLWQSPEYRGKMILARQKYEATKIKQPYRERLYGKYHNAKSRCIDPENIGYKNYGGRGIKMEWENFDAFYDDMIGTYKEGLTLERIDNDGNYCKENCRWATKKEQYYNKSSTRSVKVDKRILPLALLVDELHLESGINKDLLRNRIIRSKQPGGEVKFLREIIKAIKDQQREEIHTDMLKTCENWHGTGVAMINDYFNKIKDK